jgi:hypothetical protein
VALEAISDGQLAVSNLALAFPFSIAMSSMLIGAVGRGIAGLLVYGDIHQLGGNADYVSRPFHTLGFIKARDESMGSIELVFPEDCGRLLSTSDSCPIPSSE